MKGRKNQKDNEDLEEILAGYNICKSVFNLSETAELGLPPSDEDHQHQLSQV